MDMVRKLISEKLIERGLTMKEVSLRIPRAHSFLYQFLKVGTPRELNEHDRIALAQILGVPPDDLRGPSTALPRRKYERLATNSLATEDRRPYYPGVAEQKILAGPEAIGSTADLAVFGTEPGDSSGGLMLSQTAVDWAVRPPMLSRVQDAYALIVPRNIMEPVVRAGTVLMINPHLPPRVGDICVYRCVKDGKVFVRGGEYRGETAETWRVRQYNPAHDYTLKKSEWTACHRSVGAYFP